jgi:cytochrome P450/glycosyltransferase involved in cell wall biosynthesis
LENEPIQCSVIITSYNYGKYVKRAIDSVLSQDFAGFELIVVDDGSEDDTAAIAETYGDRIRYAHQKHSGPFIAARNGFRLARGKRIVYVDADDRLRPGALRHLHELAAARPDAALILGKCCSIDEAKGTAVYDEDLVLYDRPVENFARFCHGRLKAPIARSLIDASLLRKCDRDNFDYPSSMDLAILGLGLAEGCVQTTHHTLDVFAHAGRLRDNIRFIHKSDVTLVGVLFDPSLLSPDFMQYRRAFLGFLELERSRSYYRAGWHSLSWRSYCRAVVAEPRSLLKLRSFRRFVLSLFSSAWRKEGPVRSPRSHWLFGHQRDFYSDPIAFTANATAQSCANVRLHLQRPTYLINEEDDVQHILRHNARNYQPGGISRIAPAFARAVLGTLHPKHDQARRWLAAFFTHRNIALWAPKISAILDRRTADLPANAAFDIGPSIRSLNFEIASWIVLGCDSPEVIRKLDDLLIKSHSYSTRILRSYLRLPLWVPLRAQRVINKSEREIDAIFLGLAGQGDERSPPSLLHQMLDERRSGAGRSLEDIRSNTAGLMLASSEPVATTTTLALHRLGKDRILQERLFDEIMEARAKWNGAAGLALPSSLAELRDLVLLNSFIDEVHRLYPAEWLLTRVADQRDRLPSGLLVRRRNQVMISLGEVHKNPNAFPDPNRFDADRFRRRGGEASRSYMPFGSGAAACVGQPLSRLIIAMSLIAMLSRWRVESREDEVQLQSLNAFSLAMAGPVTMLLYRRTH